ncbi:hypothetical protein AX17_004436 [Amanita inopinata Kibby_2008]|nr:hypothetical protein AX17_004436 [Amanita inopinata Kibby_2008]
MGDFLGGDEIDFERAASAFPDISLDGEGDIPVIPTAPPAGRPASGFSFDAFDAVPVTKETIVKVTGDDEIEKFESEFPDIDIGQHHVSPPLPQTSFNALTFAPRPQPSAYSATPILHQTVDEDEPEVIKQWREKQQEEISTRDEASKARRQETISKAERAIDEFYEEYAKKKERNIRENKEQEAEYIASLTESLSVGTTWQRICDLMELQNSQSKTIARTGTGTSDLTRFKEVLLRLKREGDAAPGAAGY